MSRSPFTVSPLTPGLVPNLKFDVLSGFLVFLIAMPLCLGIATACKYPPIAGIWTAVIGGILTGFISNSQLTIKGPAAAMIVIVEGAVLELGAEFAPPGANLSTQIAVGYQLSLGVGITAGVIQILFGLLKAGNLGELVPLTPVHGMLAAIGITIVAKSMFPVLGLEAPLGPPILAIAELPGTLGKLLPGIAMIGLVSLAILLLFPYIKNRVSLLKPVPSQVVVLLAAIPMGIMLGIRGIGAEVGDPMKFLVNVPDVVPAIFNNPSIAFAMPNFQGVATATGIKYIVLFALIGSVESLLGSQAIDMIDPWRRRTDQNRELVAIGLANTICAAVGALPMISEIVRSKANIDNGGRTRYANMFHGLFLFAFVLGLPFFIRMIPATALAAMLVYTGFRLASPKEFVHSYSLGLEQLIVFVATIAVTLCTDLLSGVCAGIALKVVINLMYGAPMSSLWRSDIEVAQTDDDRVAVLKVRRAAIFANWLGLKRAILKNIDNRDEVVLDLAETRLVDHSTMQNLHQLETELQAVEKKLTIVGLENHVPLSTHPLAARRLNAQVTVTVTVIETADTASSS